jgi:hypothetical protein
MILTVRTTQQEKSKKATSWAMLLTLSIARLWLSLSLTNEEIEQGISITLWAPKSQIKPWRKETGK